MTTLSVLWVIAILLFIATTIWTGRSLASFLRNPCRRQFVRTLLVELAAIPIASLVLFYSTGGGFGPGAIIVFLMVVTGTFSLLSVAFQILSLLSRSLFKKQRFVKSEIPRFSVIGMMLPAFLLTPISGNFLIVSACDAIDRQGGERISQALYAYKGDLGVYPRQIASLVPSHIDSIPYNMCELPFDAVNRTMGTSDQNYSRYIVKECADGKSVLTIWTVGGGWGQSYDLQDKKWKHYDFSESECFIPPSAY